MDNTTCKQLLELAKALARDRSDAGLKKASDVLQHAIDRGCEDPQVLITAANYLLQGPHVTELKVKKQALEYIDKAVTVAPEDIFILENAVNGYELTLDAFPEKLDEMVKICLRILDLDPDHINCMIVLANHRKHPGVNLSLGDTIRMLEWAEELEPGNVVVASALVRLYLESGEYRKAKDLYKHILDSNEINTGDRKRFRYKVDSMVKSRNKRHRKYGVN